MTDKCVHLTPQGARFAQQLIAEYQAGRDLQWIADEFTSGSLEDVRFVIRAQESGFLDERCWLDDRFCHRMDSPERVRVEARTA